MELRPRAAKALSEFRGVERNLLARKFFQSIQYSKESIQINLFYPNPARFGAGQGQAGQGFEHKNASALCGGEFLKKQNGSPIEVSSNLSIPILIPNAIHECKKNL